MDNEEPDEVPSPDEDDPTIDVESHDPLPSPPEVHYQRPELGYPRHSTQDSSAGGGQRPSGPGNQGAGLAAGTTFVVSIIAGAVIGNWVDAHYVHAAIPWATIILTILGAVAGFSNMMRLLSRSNRNDKK